MITETVTSDSLPEILADSEAVVAAIQSGKPLDPEIARRIHDRAERIREDVFQQHGLVDIGVPAIREFRDRR